MLYTTLLEREIPVPAEVNLHHFYPLLLLLLSVLKHSCHLWICRVDLAGADTFHCKLMKNTSEEKHACFPHSVFGKITDGLSLGLSVEDLHSDVAVPRVSHHRGSQTKPTGG